MHISELQAWVQDDWEHVSKKKPDPHLQLLYLFEELGEMAEAIRKASGNKARKKMKADLEGELGDVLVVLSTIANHYHIDLNKALAKTQTKIKKRHAKEKGG